MTFDYERLTTIYQRRWKVENTHREDLNTLWWALAVLRYLTAAQLRDHLEKNVVGEPFYESEIAGRYLQEAFFGPGAREDWRNTILRATGEPLDPAHFVEALL